MAEYDDQDYINKTYTELFRVCSEQCQKLENEILSLFAELDFSNRKKYSTFFSQLSTISDSKKLTYDDRNKHYTISLTYPSYPEARRDYAEHSIFKLVQLRALMIEFLPADAKPTEKVENIGKFAARINQIDHKLKTHRNIGFCRGLMEFITGITLVIPAIRAAHAKYTRGTWNFFAPETKKIACQATEMSNTLQRGLAVR